MRSFSSPRSIQFFSVRIVRRAHLSSRGGGGSASSWWGKRSHGKALWSVGMWRREMWVGAASNGNTTWEHLAEWGGGNEAGAEREGKRSPSSSWGEAIG